MNKGILLPKKVRMGTTENFKEKHLVFLSLEHPTVFLRVNETTR